MSTVVHEAPRKTLPTSSNEESGEAVTTGHRVGIAFQGGSFLAGAVATGVMQTFVEERIFEDYDIRVFSGTSAGALVATACWLHAMRTRIIDAQSEEPIKLQTAMEPLPVSLEKMWLHYGRELFAAVPTEKIGDLYKSLDATLRHLPPWEWFVQNVRAPSFRIIFRQWIREYLNRKDLAQCVKILHQHYQTIEQKIRGQSNAPTNPSDPDAAEFKERLRDAFSVDEDLPRLVLGSANVLKGEVMGFSEFDVAVAADHAFRQAHNSGMNDADALIEGYEAGVERLYDFIEASGSLEELNDSTTIEDGPYAGIYYDGAWGQDPPINDLLEYAVKEVWLVEIFPKERPTLPSTYAERADRKEELLQNALVEHERHMIDKVNEWIRSGRFITNYDDYQAYLDWKKQRGESVSAPINFEHEFQTYHEIKTRRMPMTLDFTPGARIVNWAPFIRDKIRYGHDNARQFISGLARKSRHSKVQAQ